MLKPSLKFYYNTLQINFSKKYTVIKGYAIFAK